MFERHYKKLYETHELEETVTTKYRRGPYHDGKIVTLETMTRRSFIVGGHITKFIGAKHPDFIWKKHPDFGKKQNPSLEWYISEAVNKALTSTGTDASLVDKVSMFAVKYKI